MTKVVKKGIVAALALACAAAIVAYHYKELGERFLLQRHFRALCNGRIGASVDGTATAFFLDNCNDAGLCAASPLLSRMPDVTSLYLQSNSITDTGVTCIVSHGITKLTVNRANISDRSLIHIAQCATLRDLRIDFVPITNSGIERLAESASLQRLALARTRCDDGVIDSIASIRSLREVGITGPNITAAGIARLRGLRPDLVVGYSPY